MDPLSEGHALPQTATTPRRREDEQDLGGVPLTKKLNERLRNFRILLGLSSTNAPSTTDRVLGDEALLYYTPVGIVAVMVLLGLLHFFHVIG